VLFPSDYAISFPEWTDSVCIPSNAGSDTTTTTGTASSTTTTTPTTTTPSTTATPPPITVIVVDAVWRHARRMSYRLRALLPDVKHVQLTPEQMSVYMRKQSQPDRICTVEAAALFMQLLGESDSVTTAMVDCVRINNSALKPLATAVKGKRHRDESTSATTTATTTAIATDVTTSSL
jgi:hypothetical protein